MTHLISSKTQLTEGWTHRAACGEVVRNATWVYQFNTERNKEFLGALSPEDTCPGCYRADIADGYVYGMVPSTLRADVCVVCHAEPVCPEDGQDTCDYCAHRI